MKILEMSMRWLGAVTTGALVSACATSARVNSAADPRRDMVDLLAADRPHPSLGPDANLFGRFVGTWDADYSFLAADGTFHHKRGEVRFGWVLDGRALEDIFMTYPDSAGDERKMVAGIRWLNPQTGKWTLGFVAPTFDAVVRMEAGAEGDRIVLRGHDSKGVLLRWSFNDITPNSFVWRGESSYDEGKAWRLEEEHHMRRRSPIASGQGRGPP
jgi:hypothetical protein